MELYPRPALMADSARLRNKTGWTPRHDDLEFIIRTAWDWEKSSYPRLDIGSQAKVQWFNT